MNSMENVPGGVVRAAGQWPQVRTLSASNTHSHGPLALSDCRAQESSLLLALVLKSDLSAVLVRCEWMPAVRRPFGQGHPEVFSWWPETPGISWAVVYRGSALFPEREPSPEIFPSGLGAGRGGLKQPETSFSRLCTACRERNSFGAG